MTVAEYITYLSKLPQDAIVVASSDNFELNGAIVEVRAPYEVELKREIRTFRDAFDYGTYSVEVFTTPLKEEDKTITCVIL